MFVLVVLADWLRKEDNGDEDTGGENDAGCDAKRADVDETGDVKRDDLKIEDGAD